MRIACATGNMIFVCRDIFLKRHTTAMSLVAAPWSTRLRHRQHHFIILLIIRIIGITCCCLSLPFLWLPFAAFPFADFRCLSFGCLSFRCRSCPSLRFHCAGCLVFLCRPPADHQRCQRHCLSPPFTAFHCLSPPFTAFHCLSPPFTAVLLQPSASVR